MISEWLFDKNGDAKIYLDEDKFYSRAEVLLATLNGIEVVSENGEIIGLFKKGVLYDSDSRPIAFMENARGYIPALDDIFGQPGGPDYSDEGEDMFEYGEPRSAAASSERAGKLGESGKPANPVEGGWSDSELDDLFGTKL